MVMRVVMFSWVELRPFLIRRSYPRIFYHLDRLRRGL